MISTEWIRNFCLSLANTEEHPHFIKKAYKVKKRIFATLDFEAKKLTLKLTEIDQSVFCDFKPDKIYPANGAWGKQGWTSFEFSELHEEMLTDAITLAYNNVSVKKK
ncbi:MmcQ/YjbR family DNA-binding protein [Pedobacter aquatilis]|uniref:MmcQ/YjbR family DNA-binding protein n=1 Tax=Pedobacter aquatilis TaxID=351343 RepID=UPI00292D71C9|nr:MmcQ/YjbR family DNA-binding protein [Pedobacter aquatilis]